MQRKKQNLKQFRNILKLQKRTQINCIPSNQSNIIRKKKNPGQINFIKSFWNFHAHYLIFERSKLTLEVNIGEIRRYSKLTGINILNKFDKPYTH